MYFFYYYPVGVDVPRPRVPWVTLLVMSACTVVHLLAHTFPQLTDVAWHRYVYRPVELSWITPISAVFLHGGWVHLIGNMLYLWVFGPALERVLGRLGFLLLFVGTGALGNLVHGAIVVNFSPEAMWGGVIGASGAISGLLGLFLLRFPYANVRIAWWVFMPLQGMNKAGVAELASVIGLLLWVFMQGVMWLVNGPASGTAYGAHIGGLGTGLVLALALRMPWRASTERWLVLGRRHMRRGEAYAAVGSLKKYLESMSHDDDARLELARAQRVAGDRAGASQTYRRVVDRAIANGQLNAAAEIYVEARRGDPVFHLPLRDQKRVAHFLEKVGHDADAVRAWMDLQRFNRDHPDAVHALVRAATLLITRMRRSHEGLELFERARTEFPDHPLQGWLEQEHRKLLHASLRHDRTVSVRPGLGFSAG